METKKKTKAELEALVLDQMQKLAEMQSSHDAAEKACMSDISMLQEEIVNLGKQISKLQMECKNLQINLQKKDAIISDHISDIRILTARQEALMKFVPFWRRRKAMDELAMIY